MATTSDNYSRGNFGQNGNLFEQQESENLEDIGKASFCDDDCGDNDDDNNNRGNDDADWRKPSLAHRASSSRLERESADDTELRTFVYKDRLHSDDKDSRVARTTRNSEALVLNCNRASGQTRPNEPQERQIDDEGELTPLVSVSREATETDREERERRKRRKLLKFNVGGTIFQTEESTLFDTRTKGVKLADREFLDSLYDPDLDEYFLDRDPEVFRSILNFLRSGKLHIPSALCGPQVKEELAYWGVSEIHIQPCCWSNFNAWNSTMDSLKQLEHDSKLGAMANRDGRPQTRRLRMWRTLTDPSHSLPAKIYGWVSLLFVMAAIFSFVVSTHPTFRVPNEAARSNFNQSPQPPNSSNASTPSSPNITIAATTTAATTTVKSTGVDDFLRETEVHPALWYIDIVCLIYFSAEYILKVACAPRRLRFVTSFNGVVDVLAVSPDYVEFLVLALDPDQLNSQQFMLFIPFLRLMRAFRIFRLIRHVPGLWIMVYTLKASYKDLSLMLIFLLVGTLLFASVIFFVDDKDTFTSIPHSFWWAIVTMTTVGYGDMYPVTWPGYVIGSVTAVCGVLIIGFTIPALVNNFILYYQHVEFAVQKEKLRKQLREREDAEDCEKTERFGTEKCQTGDSVHSTLL